MIPVDGSIVGMTATGVLIALVGSLFVTFIRLVRGPSLADRVVALELSGTLVVGIIAAYAILTLESVLLDVAIALALVAFLGTVAVARYLERGGI
ncbi:MAG: hypothetical protein IT305_13635 [Chloroflexi bacterium]|nr:hypothetical protein [Chloroflexota bacterium]